MPAAPGLAPPARCTRRAARRGARRGAMPPAVRRSPRRRARPGATPVILRRRRIEIDARDAQLRMFVRQRACASPQSGACVGVEPRSAASACWPPRVSSHSGGGSPATISACTSAVTATAPRCGRALLLGRSRRQRPAPRCRMHDAVQPALAGRLERHQAAPRLGRAAASVGHPRAPITARLPGRAQGIGQRAVDQPAQPVPPRPRRPPARAASNSDCRPSAPRWLSPRGSASAEAKPHSPSRLQPRRPRQRGVVAAQIAVGEGPPAVGQADGEVEPALRRRHLEHRQQPARRQQLPHLAQRAPQIGRRMDDIGGDHDVEAARREPCATTSRSRSSTA